MNLTAYLKANHAEFEYIEKASTHHADEASRESGLPLHQIAKTIVFTDDDSKGVVGVVRADRMIGRHKLETCSGARRLKVASDEMAEKLTGFPTGGIPPVGHRKRVPVYVDREVSAMEQVWCGGGTRTRLIRLKTADILRLSAAHICDIATDQD
ncbi:MAG: YbaK/EbsC family protein [Dehalococcoidia bacterium]|nr:YbaK/EbsC family protein [Dehalococcoidia bacterium]